MRKIIAGFAISLDGYIAGPNNELDWIIIDKEIDFPEMMKQYDTYFLGRKTYEVTKRMGGRSFGKSSVYVFSNTLHSVAKPYILVSGNIKEQVLKIKNQEGKNIALFGGGGLLTSLLNLDLVDEISLPVIPVILGKGIPFVREINNRCNLTLLHTKTYSNGTVELNYTVNRPVD